MDEECERAMHIYANILGGQFLRKFNKKTKTNAYEFTAFIEKKEHQEKFQSLKFSREEHDAIQQEINRFVHFNFVKPNAVVICKKDEFKQV